MTISLSDPRQRGPQEYIIDEEQRVVRRLTPDGEVLGWIRFDLMKTSEDITGGLNNFPREAVQTYLIARDELIDRGLIQDKGE